MTQTGLVDAVVNYLPRTVAQAIGALYAPINADPPMLLGAAVVGDAPQNLGFDFGALLNPAADLPLLDLMP